MQNLITASPGSSASLKIGSDPYFQTCSRSSGATRLNGDPPSPGFTPFRPPSFTFPNSLKSRVVTVSNMNKKLFSEPVFAPSAGASAFFIRWGSRSRAAVLPILRHPYPLYRQSEKFSRRKSIALSCVFTEGPYRFATGRTCCTASRKKISGVRTRAITSLRQNPGCC
jgi:hypothetical protein